MVRFVLAVHRLTNIAKLDSVEIAFSIYFAALTQGTGHIFGACKNIDPRSRKNGKCVYVERDENGRVQYKSLQSNSNIYLI